MFLYYTLLSIVVLTFIFIIVLEKVIKPKIKAAKKAEEEHFERIRKERMRWANRHCPPPGPSGTPYDISGQNIRVVNNIDHITTSSGITGNTCVSGTYTSIASAAQEEYKIAAEDKKDEHSILLDIINTMPPS